jgi:sigma-B regulation protein RsbU (phosphoserine phosphatase)
MKNEGLDNKRTLERVVGRAVLFGVVIFLVLLLLIESFIFFIPSSRLYKREMLHEGDIVIALVGREYILDCFEKAKDIYYSAPEEVRADQYSDDYKSIVLAMVDEQYKAKRNLISDCRAAAGLEDIAFVFNDDELKRLVFVLDGNEKKKAFLPGQWISDETGMIESPSTIRATMNSDWFMPLSYGKVSGLVATDYRGVYDDDGNLVGFITINVEFNSVVSQMTAFLAVFSPIMAFLIVWVAYRGRKWMKKRILVPIADLTDKARQYNALSKTGDDEYRKPVFKTLSMNTGDEIEELWSTMVDMEKDVAIAMKKVREEAASKERIATELDLARNIQMGAIPVDFDEFAYGRGFEIYACMNPAKEVAGDFYDFFSIDETHMGLVIADVSGKGIPAALFMMISKTIMKNRAALGGKPSEILSQTNNSLSEDNPYTMFLTAWLGILDITTGEVIACNAGHEYPFVTGDDGRMHKLNDPHGVLLGCLENMEYEDYTFRIPKGGMLFVYTDGVAEALNEQDEMFGLDRLEEALNRHSAKGPKGLVESMTIELDAFKGSMDQFDDITMLAVQGCLD